MGVRAIFWRAAAALSKKSKAEADLDDIWLYVARESGSMDVATRLIDSITGRFSFLTTFPYAGRSRDGDFGTGSRSFAVGEYVIVCCIIPARPSAGMSEDGFGDRVQR